MTKMVRVLGTIWPARRERVRIWKRSHSRRFEARHGLAGRGRGRVSGTRPWRRSRTVRLCLSEPGSGLTGKGRKRLKAEATDWDRRAGAIARLLEA